MPYSAQLSHLLSITPAWVLDMFLPSAIRRHPPVYVSDTKCSLGSFFSVGTSVVGGYINTFFGSEFTDPSSRITDPGDQVITEPACSGTGPYLDIFVAIENK
jgi:hypothetical protein